MCGITTIISKTNLAVESKLLEEATDAIKHRGPDGYGYYYGSNFAMGHRRLAIIDLSDDGIQPMERHGFVITFNGEIFNYIELRDELATLGYKFSTETDTEVILQAYKHWGEDCQNHFIGMWAFVLYDAKENILFCSRDRFFQKPFLYTQCGSHFMIGSEIKQFTFHSDFKAILNLETTFDFFENQLINHSSETFFTDVFSLDGGHQLVYNLDSHQCNISKWYNPRYKLTNKLNFKAAKDKYSLLLKDSIKMRLRSDVTVGVALSGGIDSSGITCLAHDVDKEGKYTAITSCYSDKRYDELIYAEIVAKKTEFELIKKYPDLNDLISEKVLDVMTWHHEQPILSGSHFSEYSVFEEARKQNITVMLCGQGPDEHSAGYQSFFSYYYLMLLKQWKWYSLVLALKVKSGGLVSNFKQFLGFLFLNSLRYKPTPFIEYEKFSKKPLKPKAAFFGKINSIRKFSLEQIYKTSIPYQAHSEDRNSMCFSIESRSPYLDHRLVEFAISLPDKFKIRDNTNKWILREVLKPYLPPEIYNRNDKMGFVAPDEIWFKENATTIKPLLSEAVSLLNGLIKDDVLEYYDSFVRGERPFVGIFLKILSLASLCRQYKMTIPL